MNRKFVIEAVLLAIYGQLLMPSRKVEYIIPYSTILELHDIHYSGESVMPDEEEDFHVKQKIADLITFLEESLNKKKIERALLAPWRISAPLLVNTKTSLMIVFAEEKGQFGDVFDPIETELILTSQREESPILTDQIELIERIFQEGIDTQVYDIEDFDFALEDTIIKL
ncbi:MAG: ADP-heptose synthase [Paenibacillaceae bacterium]